MLITFEGPEGSGKSTLIKNLNTRLQEVGIDCVATREPGGHPTAEKIRSILLQESMNPVTELLLYQAARSEHLTKVILPALKKKKWVLCDRFTDSTLAYQGYARGLDLKLIKKMNLIATQGLVPNLTLLLDLPVETGLSRASDPNRFEKAGLAFHKKVRQGFLKIAKAEPKRIKVLSVAKLSPDQVVDQAIEIIIKRLKR